MVHLKTAVDKILCVNNQALGTMISEIINNKVIGLYVSIHKPHT